MAPKRPRPNLGAAFYVLSIGVAKSGPGTASTSDPARDEEPRLSAQDANRRAPLAQEIKQSRRELAPPAAKTGAGHAAVPFAGSVATLRPRRSAIRNLLVAPRFKRSAIDLHLHRLAAMAHWKTIAGAAV